MPPRTRLETTQIEPVVDAITGESTHVVFRFRFGRETTLTGKFDVVPVNKVDMAFPCPQVRIPVSLYPPDKGLIAVRIGDSVSRSVFMISHECHSSA